MKTQMKSSFRDRYMRFFLNFDLWSLKILIGQIHSYCINMYIMRKSIRIAAYGRLQDCFRRGSRKLCRGWEVQKDFVCFSHHIIQGGRRGGRPNILSISLAFRWLAMITWVFSGVGPDPLSPPLDPRIKSRMCEKYHYLMRWLINVMTKHCTPVLVTNAR